MNKTDMSNNDKAWNMNSLGLAYAQRFEHSVDPEDINNAIHYESQAVELIESLEHKAGFLCNLGGYLRVRYSMYQEEGDITMAVITMRESVNLCRNHNKPFLVDALIGLSSVLHRLYFLEGEIDNLKEGIECLKESQHINQDSIKNINIITPLAEHYADYYQATGQSEYLQDTIDIVAQIARLIERQNIENQSLAHLFLGGLGNLYLILYHATNNIDYLQSAIDIYRKAVNSIEENNLSKMSLLANLGSMLAERAEITSVKGDIIDARINLLEVIHYDEKHGLEIASHYQNWANVERQSFRISGDKSSMQNAIKAARKSVKLTSEKSPDFLLYLNFLGLILLDFIVAEKKEEYFTESIEALSRCLDLLDRNSYLYLPALDNLGYAFAYKYKVFKNIEDLSKAIQLYEKVLQETQLDSPDRFTREFNYTLALIDLVRYTNKKTDWLNAFQNLERLWNAYDSLFVMMPMTFKGPAQEKHIYFQLESVDLALTILSQEIKLTISEKKDILRKAFLYAESSKARIVNAMLSRGSFDYPVIPEQLLKEEQDLYQKLVAIDELQYILWERTIKEDQSMNRIHTRTTARINILRQLNKIWGNIEKITTESAEYVAIRRGIRPDWNILSDFVNRLKPNEAYLSFFIVYNRSVLFLMRPNWDAPKIFIENFGEKEWDQILMNLKSEVHQNKKEPYDWHYVLSIWMEKIMPDLKKVDTLIISPHRYCAQIPWGAIPVDGSLLGIKYKISIAPSISVLKRVKNRPPTKKKEVLIVGDPQNNLENAQMEARTIAKLFKSNPIIGHEATHQIIIEKISKVKIAHFAAHSSSNRMDPLYSSIELADESLKASDILKEKVQLDLLVASICESGIAGSLGGDENIGLGQAFLMSGARTVIVSLWKIDDESSAFFMECFYKELLGGASKSESLRSAIIKTRNIKKWSKPYFWAPFVLIGDWE